MRVELTPALILHRRAWRDTSVLVEAFSRDYGRIGLIAKGARRPKSRWRGLIEPLNALELSFSGRGELYNLTGLEPIRRYPLAGNALMGGLYASELVMRLTARDDPHPGIHDSLIALLAALADGAPAIVGLRFFERDLLDELGYGVPLTATTADDGRVRADADYVYHGVHGLRRAAGSLQDGEVAVSGRALLGLVDGRFPDRQAIHEAKALMQAALAPHLGDRPLKSVQTLAAMQQFAAAGRRPESAPSSYGEPS